MAESGWEGKDLRLRGNREARWNCADQGTARCRLFVHEVRAVRHGLDASGPGHGLPAVSRGWQPAGKADLVAGVARRGWLANNTDRRSGPWNAGRCR